MSAPSESNRFSLPALAHKAQGRAVSSAANRRGELATYVLRIRMFDRRDWLVYLGWVGMMLGLVLTSAGFLAFGTLHGALFPREAWLLPFGALVFACAIAIDTIGHRTIYKEVLRGAEGLVHGITIFCGIASCVLLCAAYRQAGAFAIPAAVLTALSFLYSLIDEAFHWHRYASKHSDRVEMWSHVFIFVGHGTMMFAWWRWYWLGYPGVAATVEALQRIS